MIPPKLVRAAAKWAPGLFLGTALLLASPAHGAVFIIANGDVAALKNAINTANSNGEDDTIELAANGTYILTARDNAINGLPAIGPDGGHTLTIHGNPATIQRSSAGGTPTFRIFYINSGASATLSRLTITHGNPGAFHGGAIYNDGEIADTALTIINCTITGNSGDYGGAIFNDGYNDPSFPAHTASLTITNSTISANTGTQYGGGIWNDGSFGHVTLTISNSTFSQNSANLDTGAIQQDAFTGIATGSITNCTFDQNSAGRDGGAIYVDGEDGSAALSVINCTFSQNGSISAGAIYNTTGIDGGSAIVQIGNTIFKTGAGGTNLVSNGTVTSLGHNLSSDNGSGFLTAGGDQINTDPMLSLAGLQNNGGPTQTIALLSTSTAINAGNDANAPARDQRYYSRNGASDIGAFEFGGAAVPVQLTGAVSIKTHGGAGSFAINLPLSGSAGVECRSGGASNAHTVVFTFANTLTIVDGATVSSGAGTVSSSGIGADAHQYIVNLTAVANAQVITVTLTNVTDSAGNYSATVSVPMGALLGDTTGNGAVNISDVAQTKIRVGQTLSASNFRSDVDANGTINATDVALVKSQSGATL